MSQNLLDFCYICLECNKNLKDLLKSENECLEIITKLKVCVSEVDWNYHKKLLVCEKCIRKLNRAHEFKRQCIQSAQTLKVYIAEIEKKRQKEKKEAAPLVLQYLNLMKDDKTVKKFPPPPLQKITPSFTKIVLTNNQSTGIQNVFLNIVPQNVIKNNGNKGETGKNFVAVPQVIQIPVKKSSAFKETDEDLSKLLNETNTEELSVEIDPLDFNMEEKAGLSTVEIRPIEIKPGNNHLRNILPKGCENYDYTNEEKMEFFNSGHFLLQDVEKSNKYNCDRCMVRFDSTTALHKHIKQVHSSQYPYKCDYCGMESASKDLFITHMNIHLNETSDLMNNSITLTDFTNNSPKINDLIIQPVKEQQEPEKIEPQPVEEEVQCNECDRIFASYQGLIRHKAKLHKSYKRKKYFIKGMKTAKCDICNRMFSTVSYMNHHRKLHERKGGEFRRRIFRVEPEGEIHGDELEDSDEVDMIEDDVRMENNTTSNIDTSVEIISIQKIKDNG